MIRFVKMECPSCGGKIKKNKMGTYTCQSCNSDFIMDREILVLLENKPIPEKVNNPNPVYLVIAGLILLACLGFVIYASNDSKKTVHPTQTTPVVRQEEKFKDAFLISFLEKVYGKTYSEISEEELTQLTAFGITKDQIYYSLNDGEIVNLPFTEFDFYLYYVSELKNFPGLKILDVAGFGLAKDSLENMTDLKELYCNESTSVILQSLPKPEGLEKLKCNVETNEDMDEMDRFANLIYLDVKFNRDITSLSEKFSSLNKLENVKIKADEITNLSAIGSSVGMKVLELDCKNLKAIDFLENMDQLEELTMTKSQIASTDSLKGKNLKKLTFMGSSNDLDYSFLSECADLEELEIDFRYSQTIPSLEKVEKLKVNALNDIAEIRCLHNLKSLRISGGEFKHFSSMEELENLEYFEISGTYLYIKGLDALTKLHKLTVVKMSGVSNYEDRLDILFQIPNLKELYLDNCLGEIDYSKIKVNESLEILNLSGASIKKDIYYETNGWETNIWYDDNFICDHTDMFANFPNLKELYLQKQTLQDIAFVEYLPQLEVLDITNNNVTDITPLENLSNFRVIHCGENAISKGKELADRFEIDETVEKNDNWFNVKW